ncbi:Rv3235 family protein [Georgenia wangjunii]|uniref:Rv3235 family protein n=1 Tax=Georgenia wangjunii TaxID=3117730 RepID=UPI002F26B0BA
MTTTTLRRPTTTRGEPVPAAGRPGTPVLPRTSTAAPWDRVRFSATTTSEPEASALVGTVPGRTPDAPPLPDPAPWAGSLVRAAVEVLVGTRPVSQLTRWLSADLYEALARRAGLAVRILGRPSTARQARIQHVHVCVVRPDVCEASVVVHDGQRVRAAAVRLEVHRGRWRATALEIG